MEEIELKSFVQALILRNKGYKFKHIKTGDIQRVITEYEELNDKIGKLNKFINGNPFFKKLDAEERNDMACQLTSMRNYSDILLSRLTRAGVDFKELI